MFTLCYLGHPLNLSPLEYVKREQFYNWDYHHVNCFDKKLAPFLSFNRFYRKSFPQKALRVIFLFTFPLLGETFRGPGVAVKQHRFALGCLLVWCNNL